MTFSALIATSGFLFILWHVWHFDRFRCLWSFKTDWFRALMVHVLLLSILSFIAYTWIEVHILYDVFYIHIGGKVQPVPWQLWTQSHHDLWRTSIYLLALGWGFLQAVHLEEFLYWGYLIQSIRVPGGPKTSWMCSGYFRVWIVAVVSGFALLFGASSIETENMDMMKAYLFMVGSGMSVLLAMASIALCIVFPSFVEAVRKQGAPGEVLDRLLFFSEMNQIRTIFRIIHTVCFMILSADAITTSKSINKNEFSSDFLFLVGQLGLFAATIISVIVLLPRNMISESVAIPNPSDSNAAAAAVFCPMRSYKRTTQGGASGKHYIELGDRLNIDREALAGLGLDAESLEMRLSPGVQNEGKFVCPSQEAPFAQAADKSKRARFSELPSLPEVVQKFRSPFDVGAKEDARKQPTQIYVTTEQTIREE